VRGVLHNQQQLLRPHMRTMHAIWRVRLQIHMPPHILSYQRSLFTVLMCHLSSAARKDLFSYGPYPISGTATACRAPSAYSPSPSVSPSPGVPLIVSPSSQPSPSPPYSPAASPAPPSPSYGAPASPSASRSPSYSNNAPPSSSGRCQPGEKTPSGRP
jgi:hypothetical protein